MAVLDRLRGAWDAFRVSEQQQHASPPLSIGPSYSEPSSRIRIRVAQDRSTLASIYNRIAIDYAGIKLSHVETDDAGSFKKELNTGLNDALTYETNMDQAPRMFRQDIALTLFDAGVIAIVPVSATVDKKTQTVKDVYTLRVGTITEWFPKHIRVNLFNEAAGIRQDILVAKSLCAIVQNPLYLVMNEANSTLQRLNKKLGMLDYVDEQSSSGKLDLIIQLPYVIKSEARRDQAEKRRSDIEFQLRESKYGIAYTDGTEKITQLNRPVENNLHKQIEMLIEKLYGELGLTSDIMNGIADASTMTNYYNRTIYPLVEAVSEAMQRSFVGAVRTKQNEKIFYLRAMMDFLTLSDVGDVVDKLARNEVASANEFRAMIGMLPSTDPKADQLINSNMPQQPDDAEPAES